MSILGNFYTRRGYFEHLKGNRLSDQKKPEAAKVAHKKAMELYSKGIDMGASKPREVMAYGVLLLRMGEYEKAKEIFRKADKMPNTTKADKRQVRINYSIAQWKVGKLDDAILILEEVSKEGNNATIYGSLGFMYIERGDKSGDYTKAKEYNLEALDYDEDDPVILDNVGQVYYRLGEREKAYEYLLKAIEKKPYQVDTLYYLTKLNQEDGNIEKAKEYIETAVSGNFSALATVSRDDVKKLHEQLKG